MKNFKKYGHDWPFLWPHAKKRVFSFNVALLFFLLVPLLLVSLDAAAQSKRVTLNYKDIPLTTVFKSITSQTGYSFLYSSDISTSNNVSVSVKNEELSKALKEVLNATLISFRIEGSRIILFKSVSNSTQQRAVIKVFDSEMAPLPGATIAFSKDDKSLATNVDGTVQANLHHGDVVKVSFIGYKPHEFVWHGQKEVAVKLQEDRLAFNEVIVTGFSTISKERSTGAVTVLKSEDLNKNVNFTMTSSLEGKVAGINSYKGALTVRGATTFSSSTNVLVVVDGLPIEGGINDINPNDVESINVLKDAASASIYGARAANGIIVITTKSAEKNKTLFDFSYNVSITPKCRVKNYRLASTSDIIDFEIAGLKNNPEFIRNPFQFFDNYDYDIRQYSPIYKLYYDELKGNISAEQRDATVNKLRNNDYRKEFEKLFWRENILQQYNMAFRKGSDNSSISFSANYQRQQYSTITSNYEGLTLNLKNTVNLSKSISATYGLYGNFSKSKSGENYGGFTSQYPYERIVNEDGQRNQIIEANYKLNDDLVSKGLYNMVYNPLDEIEQTYSNYNGSKFRGFADIDVKLFKGLKYGLKFQYEKSFSKQEYTYEKESYYMRSVINRFTDLSKPASPRYIVPQGGRFTCSRNEADNFTFRNQLDFKQKIFDHVNFDAFGGTEFRQYKSSGGSTEIYGYDPDLFLNGQEINWEELRRGVYGALDPYYYARLYPYRGNWYTLNRDFSMYVNGSLSYDNKYIVAGSWRVDKTNLFGVETRKRNRPLWSVSGSWNISSEEFMKKVEWIQNLKFRASYGANGNVDKGSSPYMIATLFRGDDVDAQVSNVATPPNDRLRWEKTSVFNAGLDFSLFKNKLSGAIEVYSKHTTDLIASSILDYSTGFSSAKFNNGEMKNRGVEVSLNYSWVNNDKWGVSTRVVYAYNKNSVEKINFAPSEASYLINYPKSYYRVGDPYNSLYSYRYAGLTAEGDPSVYDGKGNVVKNNAQMADPNALVYSGTLDPTTTGSFNQSVRYKNLALDINVVMYAGHKLRNEVVPLYSFDASSGYILDGIDKRWTPENKNTEIPRFPVYDNPGDRANFWKYADKHILSADLIKVRNISLAYNLDALWLTKVKLKSLQLRAQVNNPWFWSAAGRGIDPENFSAATGERGGFATNTPTYTFGVNLTF